MGLDQYLRGRKYFWQAGNGRGSGARQLPGCPTEDGFPVQEIVVALGYWRKHQDLHDWIVRNLAAGTDDCEPIDLTAEDIVKIMEAVPVIYASTLDHADPQQKKRFIDDTLEMFASALAWLAPIGRQEGEDAPWLNVTYRASW
jgi:hypothetical protein